MKRAGALEPTEKLVVLLKIRTSGSSGWAQTSRRWNIDNQGLSNPTAIIQCG
jgi:hypothetical protein